MNKIVKEFSDINGYHVKDKKARKKIENIQLADFVDCKVFAQIIGEKVGFNMSGYGVQGFAIGNNILCVGITSSSAGTGNLSKLITYDITDGRIIAYLDNQSIGHANGITYCSKDGLFYIACSGGQNGLNKVEVYDHMLTHIKSIGFDSKEHQKPWGIAWSDEKQSFYCNVTNNRIVQYDYDFNPVNVYTLENQTDVDLTAQSIFVAGDYLYSIWNRLDNAEGNYNKLDVYHIDTMKYYKKQLVMSHLELESCCEYKGELYLMFNSSNAGLVCKGSLYEDINIGNYIPKYLFGGSRVSTTSNADSYYCDSNYMDFLVENTSEKPFNRLYHVMNYIINSTFKEKINIYLAGDFSKYNVNIKHLPISIVIEGYKDTKPKIGGVYLQSVGVATIRNIEIVKKSDVRNALLTLKGVNYTWIDGIDFNGVGTEEDALCMFSSYATIMNSNFISDVTRHIIHCVENSEILISSGNTFTGGGVFNIPENCRLPYQFSVDKCGTDIDAIISIIAPTKNFDITKIRRSGKYRIEGSSNTTSSVKVPPELSTGGYTFTVKHINGVVVYEVVKYAGIRYIGTMSTSDGVIKWVSHSSTSVKAVKNADVMVNDGGIYLCTTDNQIGIIFGSFRPTKAIATGTLLCTFNSDTMKFKSGKTYINGVSMSGKSYSAYLTGNELYAWTPIEATENYIQWNGSIMFDSLEYSI